MNIKLIVSKLGVFYFLIIFALFSCENEKVAKNDALPTSFKLEIDSINASEFAILFIQDIYNSDTISARNKIDIEFEGDTSCCFDLLSIHEVFDELDLFTQLNKQVVLGADLSLLKYSEETEQKRILLRLFSAPQEVEYYELILDVHNNNIVVVDYKSVYSNWKASEMLNELIDISCSNKLDLSNIERSFLYLDSMQGAFNNFNPDLAQSYYKSISPILINSRLVNRVKTLIGLHSDEEVRISYLMNEIDESNVSNSRYWLFSFYLDVLQEENNQARIKLNRLKEIIGEDPILIYLEATTYFEEYNYNNALELYNDALVLDATIPNIHFAKVICLIEMKEYVQAVESLLVMEDYFEVININWDKEFMGYPDFLISDEYSRWLERVGANNEEELL